MHTQPVAASFSASLLLALVCSEMKDGVVAFEDEADAERYGELLEADGSAQVRWLCMFGSIYIVRNGPCCPPSSAQSCCSAGLSHGAALCAVLLLAAVPLMLCSTPDLPHPARLCPAGVCGSLRQP